MELRRQTNARISGEDSRGEGGCDKNEIGYNFQLEAHQSLSSKMSAPSAETSATDHRMGCHLVQMTGERF